MIEPVSLSLAVRSPCQVIGLRCSRLYLDFYDWRARNAAVLAAIRWTLNKLPKAGSWKVVKRMKLND